MPRLSTTVGLFQRLSGVEPLIRPLARSTLSQPAPKKSPTIEAMIPDLGLMVFDELDSPRDLIALIHASPNMARIYLMKKRLIVITMIKNNLDVQAVQTAIRIHHSRKVPGKTFKELGAIGACFNDMECLKILDNDVLDTIMELMYFFEPTVNECLGQDWLRNRQYLIGPGKPRPVYCGKALANLRDRLERPNKGGIALRARIYSGLFSLYQIMSLALKSGTGSIDIPVSRTQLRCDLAQLYNLPPPTKYYGIPVWGEADLMVDLSLVGVYLETLAANPCGCQDCTKLGKKDLQEIKWEELPEQPGLMRMRKLFLRCQPKHLINEMGGNSLLNGTSCSELMDMIQREWRELIDPPVPRPYVWAMGHHDPDETLPETDSWWSKLTALCRCLTRLFFGQPTRV